MTTPSRVLISGAGPGTGRALALAFARRGAALALACRRPEELEEQRAELLAAGAAKVLALRCDITDEEQRAALVRGIRDELGGLDVLVNNAFSTGHFSPIAGSNPARAWRAAFAVNLFGTMGMSADCIPLLINGGRGGVVLSISTLAAHKAQPGLAGYGASKAALEAAMRSFAVEVAEHNIRANLITPSHIDGPHLHAGIRMEAAMRGIGEDEVRASYMDQGLLRHLTTPEEIGEVAAFLASDAARSLTGQNIHLNNGQWLP